MAIQMSLGQIISIILIAVVLVMLIPIIGALTESATAQSLRTKCSLSIEAKLVGEKATFGITSPFNINCDRRIIQFDGDKAIIFNHDKFQKVSKTTPYIYNIAKQREDGIVPVPRTLNKDSENLTTDIMDALAYEATECWGVFMQGRADLLDSETWAGRTKSCVVCAEMNLNVEGLDETVDMKQHLKESQSYFDNTPGVSVADFLYTDQDPSQSRTCVQETWQQGDLHLRDGQTYAVTFYRDGATLQSSCQAVTIAPVSEVAKNCVAVLN